MAEFTIGAYLNSGQGRFFKYQKGDRLDFAFALKVEAENREQALDVAYAVLNSYPEEMFCERRYEQQVREYRMQGNRSLSVGDVLLVTWSGRDESLDPRFFAVASFGFDAVEIEEFECYECGRKFMRTREEQEEAEKLIQSPVLRDHMHVGCFKGFVDGLVATIEKDKG